MVKKSKNLKKSQKISKNHLKKKKKMKKKNVRRRKSYPLSFPILGGHNLTNSSPARFRFQGGTMSVTNGRTNEQKSSCLILDSPKRNVGPKPWS